MGPLPVFPAFPSGLIIAPTQLTQAGPSHAELEQTYRPITIQELTTVLAEASKRETTFVPQLGTVRAYTPANAATMTPEQAFAASGLPVIVK